MCQFLIGMVLKHKFEDYKDFGEALKVSIPHRYGT